MKRKPLYAAAVPVMAAPVLGIFLLIAGTYYVLRRPPLNIAIVQGVESVALKKEIQKYVDRERIAVEISELPYDELYCRVRRQVTDRKSRDFDVVLVDDPWLEALASGLMALPLPDPADFVGRTIEAGKAGGQQRGLPYVANTQLLGYCERLVRDPCGGTPEEWKDWGKVSKCAEDVVARSRRSSAPKSPDVSDAEMKSIGMVMRARRGNSIVTDFLPLLWSVSPESLPEHPGPHEQLFAPNSATALERFLQLSRTAPLGYMAFDDFHLGALMVEERAALSIVWAAWAMELHRANPDLRFVELPGLDANTRPALGVWLLAVPDNAHHPERANKLVQWLLETPSLKEAAAFGNPPARISLLTRENNPLFPAIRRSLERARLRPRLSNWRELEREIATALADRLNGRAGGGAFDQIAGRLKDAKPVCETLR